MTPVQDRAYRDYAAYVCQLQKLNPVVINTPERDS
jgi:hypothetical protein